MQWIWVKHIRSLVSHADQLVVLDATNHGLCTSILLPRRLVQSEVVPSSIYDVHVLRYLRDTIRLCYVRNYWIKMRTNKPSAENTSVNGTTSDPTSPWRNLCYVSSRSSRAAAKMSVGRVKNRVKIPKWVHMYGITTQRGRLKISLSSPWMHANCADAARTREIGSRYCPILH